MRGSSRRYLKFLEFTTLSSCHDYYHLNQAATRKIKTFKYDPTKPVEIKYKEGKGMN